MREIVLDTETTGLSPNAGDKILEIGCVELINKVSSGAVFHQYINPDRNVPEEAFAIHGLSEEFLDWYLENNMIAQDVVSNQAIKQAPGLFQSALPLLPRSAPLPAASPPPQPDDASPRPRPRRASKRARPELYHGAVLPRPRRRRRPIDAPAST